MPEVQGYGHIAGNSRSTNDHEVESVSSAPTLVRLEADYDSLRSKNQSAQLLRRLRLDEYSDWTLSFTVKVAREVGMDEATRLLGHNSLRCLRQCRRGGASIRGITKSDWQELNAALASNEAKAKVTHGTSQPLSISKE